MARRPGADRPGRGRFTDHQAMGQRTEEDTAGRSDGRSDREGALTERLRVQPRAGERVEGGVKLTMARLSPR